MPRPKTNRPTKTKLTLSVLDESKDKLRRIAEAEGVSISELVERYAESYILEVEEEKPVEIDPNQCNLFEPWTPPPPPEFPELAKVQEIFYSVLVMAEGKRLDLLEKFVKIIDSENKEILNLVIATLEEHKQISIDPNVLPDEWQIMNGICSYLTKNKAFRNKLPLLSLFIEENKVKP